jgi:hypothetical protein
MRFKDISLLKLAHLYNSKRHDVERTSVISEKDWAYSIQPLRLTRTKNILCVSLIYILIGNWVVNISCYITL